MNKNKIIGILFWILNFLLNNVLLFLLAKETTTTFWITTSFIWFSFVSSLIFQLLIWQNGTNNEDNFLHISPLIISYLYIALQLPICIFFALGSTTINYSVSIIINTLVLVCSWSLILGGLAGNKQIREVNQKQKNHRKKL